MNDVLILNNEKKYKTVYSSTIANIIKLNPETETCWKIRFYIIINFISNAILYCGKSIGIKSMTIGMTLNRVPIYFNHRLYQNV